MIGRLTQVCDRWIYTACLCFGLDLAEQARSGHPPFGAQILLNGHEYVAAAARAAGIRFVKEGNCFTRLADPAALAQTTSGAYPPGS